MVKATKWTSSWNSSIEPGKQRKYKRNAPAHIRRIIMSAHLSKELKTKYSRRSFPLRKGDTVTIMKGDLKGKSGKVTEFNTTRYKVYVEGIVNMRKDGNTSPRALEPSNLMITSLELTDPKRSQIMDRKKIKQTMEKTDEQKTS